MPPDPPSFQAYPADFASLGRPVMPRLTDASARLYASELRNAVLYGYGVVDGETEHERPGVNFAGHYLLVQWGCGSNCMRAALIEGRTGQVLALPALPGEEHDAFVLPTGTNDLRTLEFRWNSVLLGVPRKADGETYYYQLRDGSWRLLYKRATPAGHN